MRKFILVGALMLAALGLAGRSADATAPTAPAKSAVKKQTMMNVTISGPTQVVTRWSCTWTAYVQGGTAPYTLQWSWQGMVQNWSSGEFWNGAATSGGWVFLNVYVTDANGQSQWGYLSIYSDNNADFCLD